MRKFHFAMRGHDQKEIVHSDSSPQLAFLQDIIYHKTTNTTVRIIGRIVVLKENTITIDDGTALCDCYYTNNTFPKFEVSHLVNCVGNVKKQKSRLLLVATSITLIDNSTNDEILFFLQLSSPKPSLYCTANKKLEEGDVFRLIKYSTRGFGSNGIALSDLQTVLQQNNAVKEVLEQLQIRGLIYKNSDGMYLPL